MKITVFGLGYVGSVSAACLAEMGHEVWGIDTDPIKVEWISHGVAPINEQGLGRMLTKVVEKRLLHVSTDSAEAVAKTELAFICVGTPTNTSGDVNLDFLVNVIEQIDLELCKNPHSFTIVVRSTVPPNTVQNELVPILERGARKILGEDLRICFNPEFLREGSGIQDFSAPPYTVAGVFDDDTVSEKQIRKVYDSIDAPFIVMTIREAELLKVVCNAFHALKISFANEIGELAMNVGADGNRIMEVLTLDTKLNISPAYLRPGFAFGGSCLPKDVRSLTRLAKIVNLQLPLCESILPSNDQHLDRALRRINRFSGKSVGMVGLTFKSGTDDLRESPSLRLARQLIKANKKLLIYEPELNIDRLVGTNLRTLTEHLPDYKDILVDWDYLRANADIIAIARQGLVSPSDLSNLQQPVLQLYRLAL